MKPLSESTAGRATPSAAAPGTGAEGEVQGEAQLGRKKKVKRGVSCSLVENFPRGYDFRLNGRSYSGDICVYIFARKYAWMHVRSYAMMASETLLSSTRLCGSEWYPLRLDKHKQFWHALEGKILVYMSNITVEFWGEVAQPRILVWNLGTNRELSAIGLEHFLGSTNRRAHRVRRLVAIGSSLERLGQSLTQIEWKCSCNWLFCGETQPVTDCTLAMLIAIVPSVERLKQ